MCGYDYPSDFFLLQNIIASDCLSAGLNSCPQPGPNPLPQKGDFPVEQENQTGTHSMTMAVRKARLF